MFLLLTLNRFTHSSGVSIVDFEQVIAGQQVGNTFHLDFFLFYSNTYSKVQANSNMIWKFQRYNLIQEYSIRPALVPPLSFLVNCYDTIRLLIKWYRNKESFRISTDRKLSE